MRSQARLSVRTKGTLTSSGNQSLPSSEQALAGRLLYRGIRRLPVSEKPCGDSGVPAPIASLAVGTYKVLRDTAPNLFIV